MECRQLAAQPLFGKLHGVRGAPSPRLVCKSGSSPSPHTLAATLLLPSFSGQPRSEQGRGLPLGRCGGSCPESLHLHPQSLKSSPHQLPFPRRNSSTSGSWHRTSHTGVWARIHLRKPTPQDDFPKQTAFTFVSRQSRVSIRDPQTKM